MASTRAASRPCRLTKCRLRGGQRTAEALGVSRMSVWRAQERAAASGVGSCEPYQRYVMQRPPLIFFVDVRALRPGTVGAYAFALLCAMVAMALRLLIDPYVEGVQFVMFFPAVIIATTVSGLRAGLFCLVLSVIAVGFFLLPPRFSFEIEKLSDVLTTLLFILMTLSIVILMAGMRRAMECHEELSRKMEQHDEELRERQERLENELAQLRHEISP